MIIAKFLTLSTAIKLEAGSICILVSSQFEFNIS